MSELTAAQKLIAKSAVKIANRRVREELLADSGEFSLVRRLANVKNTSVAVLRGSWSPLKPDTTGDSGFGYKLKVEADGLTMMIMKDTGLYDRVREIAVETMAEAMVNNSKTFITAILNDVFSAETVAQAPIAKQSEAPVKFTRKPTRPGMKRKASVAP